MAIEKKRKVLVLSPHTDDAELGCGGTIARLIEEEHELLWVVFSAAEESLPQGFHKDTLKTEFFKVADFLGLGEENTLVFDYKVRKLPESRQEVLEKLVSIKKDFEPDLVIGPSLNDFHQDHGTIANEMIRAFKISTSIICYELPWNHIEFGTQFFVRLSEHHVEKKIAMMNFYESQFVAKRHYFSNQFIKGLSAVRGAQINCSYAEAFEVIRWQH